MANSLTYVKHRAKPIHHARPQLFMPSALICRRAGTKNKLIAFLRKSPILHSMELIKFCLVKIIPQIIHKRQLQDQYLNLGFPLILMAPDTRISMTISMLRTKSTANFSMTSMNVSIVIAIFIRA